MNLDSLRNAAHETADFLARALSPLLWTGQSPENLAGLVVAGLAGMAAAIALALAVMLYFRTGHRSPREMVRHAIATAIGLALLAFAAHDIGNVALAYLGKNTARPATEFELRWRMTTERARTIAAEMERLSRPASEAHRASPEAHRG